ncbi:hypothetical protein ACFY00_33750 [Kitasatospora sp. NPDC001540]|uniref:hypothetical protein n=1 Tax=Kitasatospora sp. NPDC001540 TaxID=3364014 RepID=UPI0036CE5DE7
MAKFFESPYRSPKAVRRNGYLTVVSSSVLMVLGLGIGIFRSWQAGALLIAIGAAGVAVFLVGMNILRRRT